MKNFFTRKNGFIILMILSTFTLAGSAAYYSVFGLSSLFAGARTEVIIMAGALEFAKIILASYLHNYWKVIGWLKWYLVSAVVILMMITSLGIYGFLTSAYQTTSDKFTILNKEVSVVDVKRNRFKEQLVDLNAEKKLLETSISSLRGGLATNNFQTERGAASQRRVLSSELKTAVQQRDILTLKIESLNDSLTSLDLQILDKESNNDVAAEIGPLRYLDKLTGWGMDKIVNWFTLLIVLVFDPLAISMVIALNKLMKEIKIEEIKPIEENPIKEEVVIEEPNKTVEETIIENVEAKEEKPDIVFEPTTEEALNLYNEEPKPKPQPTPQPPVHTYARTGADRYR
jgi:hypothetical protein